MGCYGYLVTWSVTPHPCTRRLAASYLDYADVRHSDDSSPWQAKAVASGKIAPEELEAIEAGNDDFELIDDDDWDDIRCTCACTQVFLSQQNLFYRIKLTSKYEILMMG